MILYIIRHGIAADAETPGMEDAQRPLTAKGRKKMRLIAQGIKEFEPEPDLILTSPYLRAQETADILANAFDLKKAQVIATDHLAPAGHAGQLVKEIREKYAEEQVLALVGHEPYLSSLISMLISGDPNNAIALKKGGICRLSVDEIKYDHCAVLEWLLPPKLSATFYN